MSAALLDSPSIRNWSRVRVWTNLGYLFLDYVVAAISTATALWFHFHYQDWALSGWWQVPVWAAAIFINGCVTHRIGLMGHESSHNLLVPNRKWNDILSDLLCFYPVFGSLMTVGVLNAVRVSADGLAAVTPPSRPRNLNDSTGRPPALILSDRVPRQPLAMCLTPSEK